MKNKKALDEIIKELKISLSEAQETIDALSHENSSIKSKLMAQDHVVQTMNNIFSKLPGSIYWKDTKGVYLGCSDDMCNFLGMSRKKIIGQTDVYIGEILGWPKEISAKAMQDDRYVISNNAPLLNMEEIPFTDKHGKIINQITSKVPLLDNSGRVIGVLGFSVDITERKRMEEELRTAKIAAEAGEQAKIEFIANMSHDIRTPLSGVVGLGGIVEKEIEDPSIRAKVHDMVKSADELLNMLNEILDVVSLNKNTVSALQEEPFDLPHLVQTIIDLEKSSVDFKKIQLRQSIEPTIPSVLFGDHKKIHHVLLNLVGNAIKFTKEGHVSINIKLSKKFDDSVQLLFEVSDTGMGIPAESLDKVFELFYKITPSYKGLDKGHGVGLHIVKTYTELLGGKVSVESKLNDGSKFSFSIKLKIPDKNAQPQNINQKSLNERSEELPILAQSMKVEHTTSPLESCQNAPEVLIIEDNAVALTIAQTLVSQAKCNPTAVLDGEAALELAKTKHFDLILSDVGLPGMSGMEFAQRLRAYEKKINKAPTPIVAITGHAEGKIHNECLAAGINDVVIKPIRPEILLGICQQYALFGKNAGGAPSLMTAASAVKTVKSGVLGDDLPDTEEELFTLDQFIIFDVDGARNVLGTNSVNLMDIIKTNLLIIIPQELPLLQKAHAKGDWATVADIAHKLKGGLVYVGLTRLATACQYLERYYKAGHTKLLERLYQQLLNIIEMTTSSLKSFIS